MNQQSTRVTCARVQGKGWSVFVVSGNGSSRVFKRAPGFENIDSYTMAQAQVAADSYRNELTRSK